VFRASGDTPFDHTSILKTVQQRWGLPALTARDAAAPDVGGVLSLATPRTDDPLSGIAVPASKGSNPSANKPSHLQEVYADLVSSLPVPDADGDTHRLPPRLETDYDYDRYIRERVAAWKASRAGLKK
jgi:phospholipase C